MPVFNSIVKSATFILTVIVLQVFADLTNIVKLITNNPGNYPSFIPKLLHAAHFPFKRGCHSIKRTSHEPGASANALYSGKVGLSPTAALHAIIQNLNSFTVSVPKKNQL